MKPDPPKVVVYKDEEGRQWGIVDSEGNVDDRFLGNTYTSCHVYIPQPWYWRIHDNFIRRINEWWEEELEDIAEGLRILADKIDPWS